MSGPFDVCSSVSIPQHAFADFNGDGGQDMLVSRTCAFGVGPVANAEVYFGDGSTPAVLTNSDGQIRYDVFVTDLGGDGIPDARVVERHSDGSVATRHFRSDGTGVCTEV